MHISELEAALARIIYDSSHTGIYKPWDDLPEHIQAIWHSPAKAFVPVVGTFVEDWLQQTEDRRCLGGNQRDLIAQWQQLMDGFYQ